MRDRSDKYLLILFWQYPFLSILWKKQSIHFYYLFLLSVKNEGLQYLKYEWPLDKNPLPANRIVPRS